MAAAEQGHESGTGLTVLSEDSAKWDCAILSKDSPAQAGLFHPRMAREIGVAGF